jgi:hypothetical protein
LSGTGFQPVVIHSNIQTVSHRPEACATERFLDWRCFKVFSQSSQVSSFSFKGRWGGPPCPPYLLMHPHASEGLSPGRAGGRRGLGTAGINAPRRGRIIQSQDVHTHGHQHEADGRPGPPVFMPGPPRSSFLRVLHVCSLFYDDSV